MMEISNNIKDTALIFEGGAMRGSYINVALAILKSPKIMQKVKHIYSMGTTSFGYGNTTPVAEFNVYVDAEAYSILLNSGKPITIVGFDLCQEDAALNKNDIETLMSSCKTEAEFSVSWQFHTTMPAIPLMQ